MSLLGAAVTVRFDMLCLLSLFTEELKKAVVSMMLRKDEVEEQNK